MESGTETGGGMECPLLQEGYQCDSVDLSDQVSKEYWLKCILDMLQNSKNQARNSQISDSTSESRSTEFYNTTRDQIVELSKEDYPKFSIRTQLNLIQSNLKRFGFHDPWETKKRTENKEALEEFTARLEEVDAISDPTACWEELIKGVLAGNMFDWGAKAVSDLLEENVRYGLKNAMAQILDRSWIHNGLPDFLQRIKERPYKCVAIFVDNSGCDIVLGVMPFVRQLLLVQTNVILCANTEPALNDVTCSELKGIVEECSKFCDKIEAAYKEKRLVICANGQSGPCLDLRTLEPDLCSTMLAMETDLIVLEGMGRALHTNLYAQFKCDSLKLAIVKNEFLAISLGGSLFSVICKFESS